MSTLTVEQRLGFIADSGWPIAFDGCHKLYFLQDQGRHDQAVEFGYRIYPASSIRELYEESCGLRFVTRWGYDNDDFEHLWNIEQGADWSEPTEEAL